MLYPLSQLFGQFVLGYFELDEPILFSPELSYCARVPDCSLCWPALGFELANTQIGYQLGWF